MPNVWLYHINPKNRYGYQHGWNVHEPASIFRSNDRRNWESRGSSGEMRIGDVICVFMKGMQAAEDGVYVAGKVTRVSEIDSAFDWQPDPDLSAKALVRPILRKTVYRFFPRSYGGSIQKLDNRRRRVWMSLIHGGEQVDGVPILKANSKPAKSSSVEQSWTGGETSHRNGLKGERHVVKLLAKRYPVDKGYRVRHLSATEPNADHDIEVLRGRRAVLLVEVKTRVGNPGDPVRISERQISLRHENRRRHRIFVVYLTPKGAIRICVEIGAQDNYRLEPIDHWLIPGQS